MTATAARVMIWTALLACSAANAAPSDDGAMVTLPGNHPVVGSNAQDRGPVEPAHMFSHMLLGLKRAPDMQRALDRLVDTQQDPASPNYHHWLKPADLRRFAPSDADTQKVVAWLQSKGLVVNAISPSGMTIDFAGATSQMQDAFRTPLHRMAVAGTTYIVNTTDAAVPAALASVIDGVTLSNLFPRPNLVPKSAVTVPTGTGTPFYAVGPQISPPSTTSTRCCTKPAPFRSRSPAPASPSPSSSRQTRSHRTGTTSASISACPAMPAPSPSCIRTIVVTLV